MRIPEFDKHTAHTYRHTEGYVVRAVLWTGSESVLEHLAPLKTKISFLIGDDRLHVHFDNPVDGSYSVKPGYWLVRSVDGTLVSFPPWDFEAAYTKVDS